MEYEFIDPIIYPSYLAPYLLAFIVTLFETRERLAPIEGLAFVIAGLVLINVFLNIKLKILDKLWKETLYDVVIFGGLFPFMAVTLLSPISALDPIIGAALLVFSLAAVLMASYLRMVYLDRIKDVKKGFYLLLGTIHLFVIVYGAFFMFGELNSIIFVVLAMFGFAHLMTYFVLFRKRMKNRRTVAFLGYGVNLALVPLWFLLSYLLS